MVALKQLVLYFQIKTPFYLFHHIRQVAEELSMTQAKALVLPDFLCRKILDSLTVLKKGLEDYG